MDDGRGGGRSTTTRDTAAVTGARTDRARGNPPGCGVGVVAPEAGAALSLDRANRVTTERRIRCVRP